jgi:lipoprotein-anchoring transpeptidase ErfK/SrfK
MRTFSKRTTLAVGALALAAVALSACTSGGPPTIRTVTHTVPPAQPPSSSASTVPTTPPASTSTSAGPTTTVHVSSLLSDDETYGIGMPIVLFFTPAPTDSSAFTKAVKVTVNGQPADGAWYWEQPTLDEVHSHTYEAHYRLKNYWPAHSQVHVDFPIGGLSAGPGLVYSDRLTSLDFKIGAAHISTIYAGRHDMEVRSDGKLVRTLKVSLGASATPTYHGIKVVMQKGEDLPGTDRPRPDGAVRMRGGTGSSAYDEIVDWSVRITLSGEYIHAAPWNGQIGQTSTSNGCTNLFIDPARWFYHFARVGDVAVYPRTDGPPMRPTDGLGDWNVSWPVWAQGGLLLNH